MSITDISYEPPEQDCNTYCMDCGEVIPEDNMRDYSGHNADGSEQEVTCYKCDNCGYEWSE